MDVCTGIIAGVTALVGLTGGGIALWVLQKPKISLVAVKDLGWYRTYEGGVSMIGTDVSVTVVLQNDGSEATTVDCVLEAIMGGQRTRTKSDETIPIEGRGTRREESVSFFIPKEKGCPTDAVSIDATLILRPWGNRRLICGKRTLEKRVTVPQIVGFRTREVFKR
jgi:hypothetical protein